MESRELYFAAFVVVVFVGMMFVAVNKHRLGEKRGWFRFYVALGVIGTTLFLVKFGEPLHFPLG